MNYEKIYKQLIQLRTKNSLTKCGDGKIETHHIIPVCISNDNSQTNLINLTCREHYVAHLLLVKIYENTPFYFQMLSGVTKMQCSSKNHNRSFKFNSRLYEIIRLKRAIEFSNYYKNISLAQKKIISKKISESRAGKPSPTKGKILISNEEMQISRYIDASLSSQYIVDGNFKLGMLSSEKKKRSDSGRGRKVFHNIETGEVKHFAEQQLKELDDKWKPGSNYHNKNPYQKNKKYILNVNTNEQAIIDKDQPIPQGWVNAKKQKEFKLIWITNPKTHENARIPKNSSIPQGWIHGRYLDMSILMKRERKGTTGKIWIHNDTDKKRLCIDKNLLSQYVFVGSKWKKGYKFDSI